MCMYTHVHFYQRISVFLQIRVTVFSLLPRTLAKGSSGIARALLLQILEEYPKYKKIAVEKRLCTRGGF